MLISELIATVLVADFLSGLFHWLEDAYGNENWPNAVCRTFAASVFR